VTGSLCVAWFARDGLVALYSALSRGFGTEGRGLVGSSATATWFGAAVAAVKMATPVQRRHNSPRTSLRRSR
jgi:hypothetical protein